MSSPQQRLLIKVCFRLLRRATSLALVLCVCLTLAQLIKLRAWLPWGELWRDEALAQAFLSLLGSGLVVMWEATAPLLALISCAQGYHELQRERLPLVWSSLGLAPMRLLLPAFTLGLLLAISGLITAHRLSPLALQSARASLLTLAERGVTERLLTSQLTFGAPLLKVSETFGGAPLKVSETFGGAPEQGPQKISQEVSETFGGAPERGAPKGAQKVSEIQKVSETFGGAPERGAPKGAQKVSETFGAPHLQLDSEGRAWLWWPHQERFLSAQLKELEVMEEELRLTLERVQLYSPQLNLQLNTLTLRSAESPLRGALKSLGAPNATPSERLGERAHERFTYHKRASLPLAALGWALLGALLGLWGRAERAALVGALSVGGAYSLLRFLELRARFEGGDPLLAAWSPTLLLSALTLALLVRYARGETLMR